MSSFEVFFIHKITAIMLFFINLINSITGFGAITEKPTEINGSLVCTDALGRSVITASESDKLVGVFYFLWHGQHGSNRIIDNSKLVKEHPEAINSESEWLAAGGGNQQEFHFWGEPLLGYYSANDDWVFRKHVQMLTDAAVDFIVIDTTNAFTYSEPAKSLSAYGMNICFRASMFHKLHTTPTPIPLTQSTEFTMRFITMQNSRQNIPDLTSCGSVWTASR